MVNPSFDPLIPSFAYRIWNVAGKIDKLILLRQATSAKCYGEPRATARQVESARLERKAKRLLVERDGDRFERLAMVPLNDDESKFQ